MKQPEILNKKLAHVLFYILATILVLLPFHAFFTTWLGSVFGHLMLWRAWKELLLVGGMIIALLLFFRDKKLRSALLHDRLIAIGAIFALWMLLVTVLLMRDYDAAALGLAIQVRLSAVFLLARVVMFYQIVSVKTLYLLVLAPAALVTIFGLLQMFVLPRDFLTHFGYQKNVTIPPFFTIDEQITKLRAFSTLRGPNPLGVYLLLPIVFAISLLPKFWEKNRRRFVALAALLLGMIILLYGSHSRSAWIGFIGAVALFALLEMPKKLRRIFFVAGVTLTCAMSLVLYTQRGSSFVQDVILHDNPQTGGAISSNEGHSEALTSGLRDVKKSPFYGCGAGCAGPASFHNSNGAKISENYFLQTAQEGGLVAFGLMIAFFTVVMWRLWKAKSTLSYSLLAVFMGVCIASMFSHAWADDTIAYLWWSLAGFVIYIHSGSSTATAKRPRTFQKASSRPSN